MMTRSGWCGFYLAVRSPGRLTRRRGIRARRGAARSRHPRVVRGAHRPQRLSRRRSMRRVRPRWPDGAVRMPSAGREVCRRRRRFGFNHLQEDPWVSSAFSRMQVRNCSDRKSRDAAAAADPAEKQARVAAANDKAAKAIEAYIASQKLDAAGLEGRIRRHDQHRDGIRPGRRSGDQGADHPVLRQRAGCACSQRP